MCEKNQNGYLPSYSNCSNSENASTCLRKSRSREKRQQVCPASPLSIKNVTKHNCLNQKRRCNSFCVRSMSTPTRTCGNYKPLNEKFTNSTAMRSLSSPAHSQNRPLNKTVSSGGPKTNLRKSSSNRGKYNKNSKRKKKKKTSSEKLETIMQPKESFSEETVPKSTEDDTTTTSKVDDKSKTQNCNTCTINHDQHEYLQFALGITEDIIKNENYSNDEIFRVFNKHIVENLGKLDFQKMVKQIEYLCEEINLNFCKNDCGPFSRYKINNEALYGALDYDGGFPNPLPENRKRDKKDSQSTIGVVIIPKNPILVTNPSIFDKNKSTNKTTSARPLAIYRETLREETDVSTTEAVPFETVKEEEEEEDDDDDEPEREIPEEEKKNESQQRPIKKIYKPLLNKCDKCGLVKPKKIGDNSPQVSPGELCIPGQKCPNEKSSKLKTKQKEMATLKRHSNDESASIKTDASTQQNEITIIKPHLKQKKKTEPPDDKKRTLEKTVETNDVPQMDTPSGYSKCVAVQTILEDILECILREEPEECMKSGDNVLVDNTSKASSEESKSLGEKQKVYTESKPDFGFTEIDRMRGDSETRSQGSNTAAKGKVAKPCIPTTCRMIGASQFLDDLVLVNGPIYIPKSAIYKMP